MWRRRLPPRFRRRLLKQKKEHEIQGPLSTTSYFSPYLLKLARANLEMFGALQRTVYSRTASLQPMRICTMTASYIDADSATLFTVNTSRHIAF